MLISVVIVCRVGGAAGQPIVNGIVENVVVVGEAVVVTVGLDSSMLIYCGMGQLRRVGICARSMTGVVM
jgi:hypothetical protein